MKTRSFLSAFLLVLVFSFSGCFGIRIRIRENIDFPAARFAKAWERIAWLEKHNPQRAGRASSLRLLAYDGREREAVYLAVPAWLIGMAGRAGSSHGHDAVRFMDRHFDLGRLRPSDLLRTGPGLLAEIEEEETRVLVWLE